MSFCYFTKFVDKNGKKLIALRKTTSFMLVKKPFLFWSKGALEIINKPVFKLDTIFDALIDSKFVHILHPKRFELMGDLNKVILAGSVSNVKVIQNDIPFVNLDSVKEYATKHIRAARLLAAIKTKNKAQDFTQQRLYTLCKENGVDIHITSEGKLDVSNDINGFLHILDRRRYVYHLDDKSEYYQAKSRDLVD